MLSTTMARSDGSAPSEAGVEPGRGLPEDVLPPYTAMLHAYHRTFASELRALIATLSCTRQARVLDMPCGDGCYSAWLCAHAGTVHAVDRSLPMLALAERHLNRFQLLQQVRLIQADVHDLPFPARHF